MRIRFLSLMSAVILSLTLFSSIANVEASNCSMLAYNVDDARSNLRRAANETDFESAKNYARRAKNSLEEAAMSAMDCKCDMAYMEFDTAASHARRASYADDPEEFVYSLNRSIRAFNSALEALSYCARSGDRTHKLSQVLLCWVLVVPSYSET